MVITLNHTWRSIKPTVVRLLGTVGLQGTFCFGGAGTFKYNHALETRACGRLFKGWRDTVRGRIMHIICSHSHYILTLRRLCRYHLHTFVHGKHSGCQFPAVLHSFRIETVSCLAIHLRSRRLGTSDSRTVREQALRCTLYSAHAPLTRMALQLLFPALPVFDAPADRGVAKWKEGIEDKLPTCCAE